MKKIILLIGILILTGCTRSTPEPDSILVGLMPDVTSLPFIIAQERGFLPDNVSIEVFRSAADRDAALHGGHLDVLVSDMIALLLNNQGGFNLYAISETFGAYGLVAHPDSGITSVADLRGRQIGLSINTIIEFSTDQFLAIYGINPEEVEKVSVPQIPQRFELLEAGHIDAAAMPEPFPSAAVASGLVRLADSYELGINPGVLLAWADTYYNKRQELIALAEAFDKAIEYINSTPSNLLMPVAVEIMGLPDAALDFVVPEMTTFRKPQELQFYRARDWMLGNGLLEMEFTFEELVREIG